MSQIVLPRVTVTTPESDPINMASGAFNPVYEVPAWVRESPELIGRGIELVMILQLFSVVVSDELRLTRAHFRRKKIKKIRKFSPSLATHSEALKLHM